MSEETEGRTSPTTATVHHSIFEEGVGELERTSSALAWSGVAAGLYMGFSFLGSGVLRAHLPQAHWEPLVTALGYTLGFVLVIIGRQQLFTENTLTVMLPLFHRRDARTFANVLRVWGIVLVANVIGCLIFAFVLARTELVDGEVFAALKALATQSTSHTFGVQFLRGIFAGWLIALVVWLLPYAENAHVLVIVLLTYTIGAAQLPHVIIGTIETIFLLFIGKAGWSEFFIGFFLPVLLGNVLGGVGLVAALGHAQVAANGDLEEEEDEEENGLIIA
ncbi:MAG: formate/nitrite transporter family protein [Acidobacteria bacterium]|nr:formate/nitrite transporter family protein [Acidobacteriota bacterium]MBV9478889.1 formate/nitrite transporter family protein [Acidobacteriota bacterium]